MSHFLETVAVVEGQGEQNLAGSDLQRQLLYPITRDVFEVLEELFT